MSWIIIIIGDFMFKKEDIFRWWERHASCWLDNAPAGDSENWFYYVISSVCHIFGYLFFAIIIDDCLVAAAQWKLYYGPC